jgi:hypothetical protein
MEDTAIIAIAQFVNTVCAPRQNEEDGDRQEAYEDLELRGEHCTTIAPPTTHIIRIKGYEDAQGEDLECKSSKRYINTDITSAARRETTARSLKGNGNNIRRYESPIIPPRIESRVLRAKGIHARRVKIIEE